MKILMLSDRIPPENRGGAGEVAWRLARAFADAGHEMHVLSATAGESFEAVREGIATYHIHSDYPERWRAYLSLYNPQTVKAIRALYERLQPDVINAHNIHLDLSYHSLTIASQMGIPVIFSSHDVMLFAYHKLSYFVTPDMNAVTDARAYRLPPFFNLRQMRARYNPLRNWWIRRVLIRDVVARTAPSHELARAHQANDLPPFEIVHNGIQISDMDASPAVIDDLRQSLNLDGRKVILFAGRLTGAKGTRQLLDAMLDIIDAEPLATILVLSAQSIAEQVQAPEYRILREQHMVSGGWLTGERLAAAYHLADVVVVPSIVFDTFPTVILEAMATASPVIATCFGGAREAVVDGETGYIVNPVNRVELATRLRQLLADDALRQQMGLAGLARVRTQFTMIQQRDHMLKLFQQHVPGR